MAHLFEEGKDIPHGIPERGLLDGVYSGRKMADDCPQDDIQGAKEAG